jgi:dTDP-4-amino-4,6-dideoxygalactose transaminase
MARVPFVDLSAQYATIKDEIDVAISEVVRGTHFILGQDVKAFEEAFATFCGATYAFGVDSGTSALELSLRAYGVEPATRSSLQLTHLSRPHSPFRTQALRLSW